MSSFAKHLKGRIDYDEKFKAAIKKSGLVKYPQTRMTLRNPFKQRIVMIKTGLVLASSKAQIPNTTHTINTLPNSSTHNMNPTLTERVAYFSYTLLAFSLTHIPMDSIYVPWIQSLKQRRHICWLQPYAERNCLEQATTLTYSRSTVSYYPQFRAVSLTMIAPSLEMMEPNIQPLKSPRIEYVQTGDDRKIAYKIAVMKERRRREGIKEEVIYFHFTWKCVDDEYEWADSRKKFKNSFVASDSASEDEVKTWRVIKTPQWHRRAIRALR
ncbi:hypothetical protein BC829DRAFT_461005 [Chytridium lagenaria]|nr:hypothetical protein BC829DRAFT_461005 [Chytridium lagenaria]